MNKMIKALILLLFLSNNIHCQQAEEQRTITNLRSKYKTGWNSWNSSNILEQSLLPSGMQVKWSIKKRQAFDEPYLSYALIGERSEKAAVIRPGVHSLLGNYSNFELEWEGLLLEVEYASDPDQLVMCIHPQKIDGDFKLIIEGACLWDKDYSIEHKEDHLELSSADRELDIYATGKDVEDAFIPSNTPHLIKQLDDRIYICAGYNLSVEDAQAFIDEQKQLFDDKARKMDEESELYKAVISGIAWNIIYDPKNDRIIPTVGRLWNKEYGGYCLFGWDNFFLAYMIALENEELAQLACMEHLTGLTKEGFIPNDNAGNGRKSWDRSQPPVGGLMTKAIYDIKPKEEFIQFCFPALYKWNTWYYKNRMNEGLLSYGSSPAPNPFHEKARENMQAAKYESGMDDSPMYSDVVFNRKKHCMELQDVGLNSLYIADCYALASMARTLGKDKESQQLMDRAKRIEDNLRKRWSDDHLYFLNYNTETQKESLRLSPTLFYPLLTPIPDERQKKAVMKHLYSPQAFGGMYVLPSVDREDPDFNKQRYWKGAIWPPLNFLVYLGLKTSRMDAAAKSLSDKSKALFLKEWYRKGYVSENYSSITGTGDDPRLSSDRFHSWGALMGIIPLIESNRMKYKPLNYYRRK